MNAVRNFAEMIELFRNMPEKKRVAVVCPDDEPTVKAVERCAEENLARIILVTARLNDNAAKALNDRFPDIEVVETESVDDAAAMGVKLVRDGKADVLMKGTINTDNLLRAILNKECGLLPPGRIMTHVTAVETSAYDKLILFSDAAVIPRPTLDQFDAMVKYDTALAHRLGIKQPKVALIHFTEKVNTKFQHTIDYVEIKERATQGLYGEVSVAGPMDVKTACDAHSAEIKGIVSDVVGKADILIFPTLEAANTFYKTISLFAKARMAGIIHGTIAPVVIPSRADSADSKFCSLVLACLA